MTFGNIRSSYITEFKLNSGTDKATRLNKEVNFLELSNYEAAVMFDKNIFVSDSSNIMKGYRTLRKRTANVMGII